MAANSKFSVATHVLAAVAYFEDDANLASNGWVSSETIASSIRTNPVVVRRLLGELRKAGLIATQAGKFGGARLSRPAAKISLREVYEAIGGDPLFAFHSSPPNPRCPVGRSMDRAMGKLFGTVSDALDKTLGSYRLSDVVSDVR